MGSFTVYFAETTDNSGNYLKTDRPFKCLIPKEFGGGALIDDNYEDYGEIHDRKGKIYDWYDLLAAWNMKEDNFHVFHNNVVNLREKYIKEIQDKMPALIWKDDCFTLKEDLLESFVLEVIDEIETLQIKETDSREIGLYSRTLDELQHNLESVQKLSKRLSTLKDIEDRDIVNYSLSLYNKKLAKQILLFYCQKEDSLRYMSLYYGYGSYLDDSFYILERYNEKFKKVPKLPVNEKYDGLRDFGIDLACYDIPHSCLKYPLKIVPIDWKGTYETCKGFSKSYRG